MAKFRVGVLQSLIFEDCYVIQKSIGTDGLIGVCTIIWKRQ